MKTKINDNTDKMESRLKIVFRASVVAIAVNISLGIFKAIVGVITHSIAITMDAINNFTDAGSSLITILSSYFATKHPNKKHPFGYGRTEYLGTLLIAVIILYAGITSFIESVKGIINPVTAEYSKVSLIIVAVAVVAKAILSLFIMNSGKKANSDSLIASGKESIGDVTISISTIAAAFVFIYTNISVEAWLGATIAILIIKTGFEILKETVGKILGTGGDAELVRNIKAAIASHDGVEGAYDLVLNNYGPDMYLASVHLEVKDTMSVNEFDDLSRKVQSDILERFGVYLSAVGLYSINTKDSNITSIRDDIRKIALDTEHVNQIHGFYLDEKNKTIRFDMVVSFNAKDRRKVYTDTIEIIKQKYPDYTIDAGLDTDYNEI